MAPVTLDSPLVPVDQPELSSEVDLTLRLIAMV